jgi:hypothetical protein
VAKDEPPRWPGNLAAKLRIKDETGHTLLSLPFFPGY